MFRDNYAFSQTKDLWDESGRSKEYGPELLGAKEEIRDFSRSTHEEIFLILQKKK